MPPSSGTQENINRRSSSRLGTTSQEIATTKSEVIDIVSARKYLERTAMAISGQPYATDKLADILLHITQMKGVSLPAQTAIRAVAFILEDTAAIEIADSISKYVTAAISPHIAKLHEVAEAIATTSDIMNDTQTKIKESSITPSNPSAESLIETTLVNTRLEKIQQTVDTLSTQVKETSRQGGYKAALLTGLDDQGNTNQQTIQRAAREAIKARQILIDISPDSPIAPGKVTHAQLVDKIKKALKNIQKDTTPDLEIRVVKQFPNGGTIVEFMKPEAAKHLKQEAIKLDFINALDPKAKLKERAYPVVIRFVPLTFNPTDEEQIQNLERENGWEQGVIASARWIKPPGKRADTQQVAHILATLNNPNTANEGIRDGITLNHTRLQMAKNRQEPIRCAKCQRYGHIARECLSHKDTCANCAGEHRTSDCDNQHSRGCISCESNDHSSSDRGCPEFTRKCSELESRRPENLMPYYPTDEAWTQVSAPPKAPPYIKTITPTPYQSEPPRQTQGTLERHLGPRGRGNGPTRGHPRHSGFSSYTRPNERDRPTPNSHRNTTEATLPPPLHV